MSEYKFDFKFIKTEFDNLLLRLENLLEREWRDRASTDCQIVLEGHLRAARIAWEAVLYLVGDRIEAGKKREFVYATPPLVRSILDAYVNVIFLLEHIEEHTKRYLDLGWHEWNERLKHWKVVQREAPGWSRYLDGLQATLDKLKKERGLSGTEFKEKERWPILGRMKDDPRLSGETQQFLSFLNEWFYRDFSADAHLSAPGLFRRTGYRFNDPSVADAEFHRTRTEILVRALGALLGMVSEIEIKLEFGAKEKTKYCWTILRDPFPALDEIRLRRYSGLRSARWERKAPRSPLTPDLSGLTISLHEPTTGKRRNGKDPRTRGPEDPRKSYCFFTSCATAHPCSRSSGKPIPRR